ncbi:hypothetical protein [Piscirickettsia salmonis]|uniref:hypothetical protein n=1 Tax=Piscirickettsia salmonis TaxID=1238 RepID=UPI0011874D1B|nr:hypothetical protein [Piscirickettsia salmonis]
MLGDFASLDVQNTYRGSDAYAFLTLSFVDLYRAVNFYISQKGQCVGVIKPRLCSCRVLSSSHTKIGADCVLK